MIQPALKILHKKKYITVFKKCPRSGIETRCDPVSSDETNVRDDITHCTSGQSFAGLILMSNPIISQYSPDPVLSKRQTVASGSNWLIHLPSLSATFLNHATARH